MKLPNWIKDIHFAFSLKDDGQMSVKRGVLEEVISNRRMFLERHNLSLEKVVIGELTHSNKIALLNDEHRGRGSLGINSIPLVDGYVTRSREVLLMTTHADCSPVLIFDPITQIIGQAHAGWRGLAKGIVSNLIQGFISLGSRDTADLQVWVGPTVGVCCYPVSEEVSNEFPQHCSVRADEFIRLDLNEVVKTQLMANRVPPENITFSGVCTSCNPTYSSYRRDGDTMNAMAMISGLKQ